MGWLGMGDGTLPPSSLGGEVEVGMHFTAVMEAEMPLLSLWPRKKLERREWYCCFMVRKQISSRQRAVTRKIAESLRLY